MVVLISICPSSINFSIEALIKEAFIPLSIVKKNAGITRDVGALPNITGRYGRIQTRVVGGEVQEGALYKESPIKDSFSGGSNWDIVYIGIDASRSSGIYGTSTGVQPPSVQTLPCIKT